MKVFEAIAAIAFPHGTLFSLPLLIRLSKGFAVALA
jgi:hypothetical protein